MNVLCFQIEMARRKISSILLSDVLLLLIGINSLATAYTNPLGKFYVWSINDLAAYLHCNEFFQQKKIVECIY